MGAQSLITDGDVEMNTIEYEPFLVALSFVISVFGSYTALRLAIAIPQARTWAAVIGSVTGASVALGGGAIWSMHFIGMSRPRSACSSWDAATADRGTCRWAESSPDSVLH